jgi:hypothetical protein
LEQTIGGPHAIGRVGDWLLENDQVRFVIADKGIGRVNTTFGGTLVDADLQRIGNDNRGNDQLAELLPGFVFTVINPTDVCIPTPAGSCPTSDSDPILDGSDGGDAAIMVRGVGGDLFEMIALLNTGLVQPSALEFTQVYRLHPGNRFVTIETTIRNTSTGAHPFPYVDPPQLKNLGFAIPGVENLPGLSVPIGQLPLLGGEQTLFAPGVAGFNVRFAIEGSYAPATYGGFPAFPGLTVDFLASKGPGVSYGLALPMAMDNYVNTYASQYPNQDITPYSMLLPFTYAGVTAAYQYEPPAQLNAGAQVTWTSFFFVGKGDVGSILDAILQQRGVATGSFGGRVVDSLSQAPVAGASVVVLDKQDRPIDQLDTDSGGNFLGTLPPGDYKYQVVTDARWPSLPQAFTISAGQATGAFVQLDPPATIAVSAVDELGRHAPMKIQLLAHDNRIAQPTPIDGRGLLYDLRLGERVRPTAFDGSDRFIENAFWTNDGRVETQVPPGTYDIVVSRGPEYEVSTVTVTVAAGSYDAEQIQLARAFTSDGWIAGDFHIHAQPSTDSGLPIPDRVTSCAAEGLDVAVATDHNYITDYSPVIANLGIDQWLLGMSGMELTTFEMGHFIGFPLRVDPGSTRGGEFVWAGQVPQKLFDQLRTDLALDPGNGIVDVAHPRQAVLGYFAQFYIDQATAQPYTPDSIMGVFTPYGDEFKPQNFSYDFDALELITGRRNEDIHAYRAPNPLPPPPYPTQYPAPVAGQIVVDGSGRPLFPGVVETWFTLLDHGKIATGLGASDSHHLIGDEPGYARTMLFVGAGKDTPGGYTRDDVVAAVKGHHAIATNAPLLEMTIDGHGIGDTIVDTSGSVVVNVHVRAPSWAQVDHVIVYTNGGTVVLDQAVPNTSGHVTDFTTSVTLHPTVDTWVVAEATGSMNMFPVLTAQEFPPLDVTVIIGALAAGIKGLSNLPLTSSLKPIRIHTSTPYAITNPIFVDIDGNGWHAPLPPLARTKPPNRTAPDVRARFDAIQEMK